MSSKDPLAAHKVPVRIVPPDSRDSGVAVGEPLDSSDPPSASDLAAKLEGKHGKQKSAVAAKPPAEAPVEPPLPPPLKPAVVPVYEVLTQRTVSWGGQTLTLKPGKKFSEATHGPGIEKRMVEAGIEFRKVVS